MSTLAMPKSERGLAHVPMSSYEQSVHAQSFMAVVCKMWAHGATHVSTFQPWATRVGLVVDEVTLPYIWLALVPLRTPSFLQGSL